MSSISHPDLVRWLVIFYYQLTQNENKLKRHLQLVGSEVPCRDC